MDRQIYKGESLLETRWRNLGSGGKVW